LARAQGCVVKSDAGSELLEGVERSSSGRAFVGKRFSRQDFVGGSTTRTRLDDVSNRLPHKLQTESEMALFFECMQMCAQIPLDTDRHC
jgi:hypothetical protein